MFRVPFDLKEAFGRARPPIKVTIRGHTWRTTPGVYDGVGYVVVNRSVKAATGVDAPDRVRVEMEVDTEPRTVRFRPTSATRSARTTQPGRRSRAVLLPSPRVRRVGRGGEASGDPRRRIAATVERAAEGLPQR